MPDEVIVGLARRMAAGPTLITVAHGLQRAEHGEQPVWMAITLAAMLGGIGLPGAGFAYALGIFANIGEAPLAIEIPSFPQGRNPIETFIPVARIADMLLCPGEGYDYDGQRLTYPDIRLVYWSGGNPFHHHQDLGRLRRAFGRPDTIIVHEPYWTATARHADIVLPATITLEREDVGSSRNDPGVIAMHRVLQPHGLARDDYAIFAELADRLGHGATFTEGRDAHDWLRHTYAGLAERLTNAGEATPTFEQFWESGELMLPVADEVGGWLRRFREDPRPIRWTRPAAASRSSPTPSRVSTTRTVRVTPRGSRRTSGWGASGLPRIRYSSSRTSQQGDCTASWTSAARASSRRSRAGRSPG